MASSFVSTRLEDLAPLRWMGDLAERFTAAFGADQDAAVAELKEAVSMRIAEFCPDDALGRFAVNVQLPTFEGEPPAALRAREVQAFPTWEEAGLPQAIIRSLDAWGNPGVTVTNYADAPDGSDWFSKFWVTMPGYAVNPQVWGVFEWGDPSLWGGATAQQLAQIYGQILYWKSPQSIPVSVTIDFQGAAPNVELGMSNLWGEPWVVWGGFLWGNGRWVTGEIPAPHVPRS